MERRHYGENDTMRMRVKVPRELLPKHMASHVNLTPIRKYFNRTVLAKSGWRLGENYGNIRRKTEKLPNGKKVVIFTITAVHRQRYPRTEEKIRRGLEMM